MRPLFAVLILVMGSMVTQAQNLDKAIHLNDAEDFRGDAQVLELVETYTSILDKAVAKTKTISRYDAAQKLIVKEHYVDDKLLSKDTFTYYSPGGLKKAWIAESWSAGGVYQRKIQNYVYNDRGALVRIRDFDQKGYLTHESRLKTNGLLLPYLLDKYDDKDNLQGPSEEAEFLWEGNRYIIKRLNAMGKESSRDTFVLDFKKAAAFPAVGEMFNIQGDLIRAAQNAYEYAYDEQGNWVEKKRVLVQLTNGKEKKHLLEKWDRKYVYRAKK